MYQTLRVTRCGLTGTAYLNFLQNTIDDLLNDIPLNQKQQMGIQYNGAPVYFSIAIRKHLHGTFRQKWIGRGDPVSWPARLFNLISLDFFFFFGGDI